VQDELLDELPVDDPGALGCRRDLERLNWIMGNAGLLCGLLETRSQRQPPKRIVELGAGDGKFMLRLAKYFSPRWKGVEVVLVDCKDAMSDETRAEFARLGWNVNYAVSDVFAWLEKRDAPVADIMISNLFLHQFFAKEAARLLTMSAARTNFFAACEPKRGQLQLIFSKLVGFIGCNAVSRHDAPISVHAGFAGQEISSLWPKGPEWRLRERSALIFCHTFAAERIA
jgi:hypothetical protein